MGAWSKDSLLLSSLHVGSEDQTQVVRLGASTFPAEPPFFYSLVVPSWRVQFFSTLSLVDSFMSPRQAPTFLL